MPGPNSQGPGPQNLTANSLKSATTVVSVSSATAPTSGQVLTAISGSAATWQDAGGGGVEAGSPFTTGQYVVVSGANEIESDGVKRYVALLTQTGTDAPVATVLENTLGGTVVWTRGGVGNYTGTLAGAFSANKTAAFIQAATQTSGERNNFAAIGRTGDNTVIVSSSSMDFSGPSFGAADDVLANATAVIWVYP